MKEVTLKNGVVIKTPFMKTVEAAAFCGLARSTFESKGKNLPYAGSSKNRRYHVDVLTAWIEGRLDGIPFDPEKTVTGRRKPPMARGKFRGLVHPITGKVYLNRDRLGAV